MESIKLVLPNEEKNELQWLSDKALDSGLVSEVWAAVAYASNASLFDECVKHGVKFKLWGRDDYSVPVDLGFMGKFLANMHLGHCCRLIRGDHYHPKVIWWKGFGAYIGSANLTQFAWGGNIEAGVFISEEELRMRGSFLSDLEDFFERLDGLSFELTQEYINHMKSVYSAINWNNKAGELHGNGHPGGTEFKGLLMRVKRKPADSRADAYAGEQFSAMEELRMISDRLAGRNPDWVGEDALPGIVLDQFLRLYYDEFVLDGKKSRHLELHAENKGRRTDALEDSIQLWSSLNKGSAKDSPGIILEVGNFMRDKLSEKSLLNIGKEDLICVLSHNNAYHAYASTNASIEKLGRDVEGNSAARVRRCSEIVADCGFREVLYWVLHGGPRSQIFKRVYDACYGERKIGFVGKSTMREMVGWAYSSDFSGERFIPVRNERISKALYALGSRLA